VSAFRLDTYEVTVSRFRTFVADQRHELPAGSGKVPNAAGDHGWLPEWNAITHAVLTEPGSRQRELDCDRQGTWTENPGENESRPINCLNYFEAFAFCIWDGGRLPTEAEWHFAAEGGSEGRRYPWSNPAASAEVDSTHAVYAPSSFLEVVGSRSPKGDGRWGHADLAGNALEQLRDIVSGQFAPSFYPATCNDCVRLDKDGHMAGGGSFSSSAASLRSAIRSQAPYATRIPGAGVRCARPTE
jgi:formylglycine-generating enzyme required for sulfatase activity